MVSDILEHPAGSGPAAGAGTKPSRATSGLRTIMVVADLANDAESRLRLAVSLADRFGADLIGAAASEIELPVFGAEYPEAAAEIITREETRATTDLANAKTLFLREVGDRTNVEWLEAISSPQSFVQKRSCLADLVVVGRRGRDDAKPGPMELRPGDVVMSIGRPVLVVPPGVSELAARRVVIGWKDSRETRRALTDSLPFLAAAEEVTIALIGPDVHKSDADLPVAFLKHHGIAAEVVAARQPEDLVAETLLDIALAGAADLVVAGAYAHSRAREWAFGGATRDLLDFGSVCCLFSH